MTPAELDLSIVIPAHNEERMIAGQLGALAEQAWPGHQWEVIVVDNRSTDATVAVVDSFRDRIANLRVVDASNRAGLSYARNTGIGAARSDRIAICDADDLVGQGWVEAMGVALSGHPLVAGLIEVDRLNPMWLADSRGRNFEAGPVDFRGLFPIASGGNLGLHRDLWKDLGGFEEHVAGAEDIHFSMKAWLKGTTLYFEPKAVLHYRYRSDPPALWRQGRAYGRARVTVCCDLHQRGYKPKRFAGWRSWAWLFIRLPSLRTSEGRSAWLWVAANRLGHLEESLRSRSVYL